MASARAGRRTLLISTDPAPSAGDALRQPLTASPRRVAGAGGRLHALEVDASRALERWLAPRRAVLETIALRGTWLDREDVAGLLRLSLPGIDEVAALLEIDRLGGGGRYELVVVDTAPTGHTLRMLAMPDLLRTLAAVFDRMQGKHRAMVEALRGYWTPEETDELIRSLNDEGRRLAGLVRDGRRTTMSWVTLPEPMAVAETADALCELDRLGVRVDAIIVNRLTPAPTSPCRWCRARRAFERTAVRSLLAQLSERRSSDAVRIATIEARATEPRGMTALAAIAAEMEKLPHLPRAGPRDTRVAGATVSTPAIHGQRAALPVDVSLLMFGGKGGVGKTTCAAAAAVTAAAKAPRRPVLLLSADPAHSLADVLGMPLDDEPRRIAGAPSTLRARELDAAGRFESLKSRYASAVDALFDRLVRGSGLSVSADRQAMQDLMELAPPGLDELIAIIEVSNALEPDGPAADALVVLDTAPSGHALRLLEMPAIVHEWVKALMSILLKYQPVVGVGELGAVLLQMSQGLGRLQALLADSSRSAFIAVTRPAALPAAETARLVSRLQALDIHVPVVLVNAVGAGTCRRCVVERRDQQRARSLIRRMVRDRTRRRSRTVLIAPAVVPPPHGPRMLRAWRRSWTVE